MKNINEKGLKMGKIMEINVNSTSKSEVLARVEDQISHNKKFYIVTPNPELILMAQTNQRLKNALNDADVSIPDGIGVIQGLKYLSLKSPKTLLLKVPVVFCQGLIVGAATIFDRKWLTEEFHPIKGRSLFLDLVKLANNKKWKVVLLGGLGDEAALSSNKLQKKYPKLEIKSVKGPMFDKNTKPVTGKEEQIEREAIEEINKFTPELLFVAFGNPKQEIWVHEHLRNLNIGGAMCVGGSFRYVAGQSILPPKWMGEIGLEWFWRLFTEPKRFVRIFRAAVIFPVRAFLNKFSDK